MRFRVQVQCRNQVPLGYEYRRPGRGPSMGSERLPLRWPERLPFPTLLRRLLQVPEQEPHKGQALPQPSGGREKPGQCRNQNSETRNQNSLPEKDLDQVGRGTRNEHTMYE